MLMFKKFIVSVMSLHKAPRIWNPCKDLLSKVKENNYAIVILNTPINFSFNPALIVGLWEQAKVRVTVDGGTERWLTWLTMNESEFGDIPHPDLITGDMDSIKQDILDHYKGISATTIVRTPDQNETDFFKSLIELQNHCSSNDIKLDTIYVLSDTSGRLDQVMANINTLYKVRNIMSDIDIFLIAASSVSWLLDTGSHEITLPQELIKSKSWCALLPVGAPSIVTTSGLKWNLDEDTLEFGGIVSSSNTYDGTCPINIKTSSPLIWSMSIDSLL
ncbi:thiamin pyrophosphokinase 1 [Diabrotica virgifera virgifera]|uniref:Thiamin pyrophosphokinase thiamin-binding domain-containing protein n=1 Tax=Diabrotica virgifera virgifera TaxID=50390 RepID=A0ABM5KIC6_DIAVI|nr:thiamin pyrophosphokinase 1 [Diabrotica virgifera virgifera]XP_050509969.1 thiamin pyrophosphokinase 1 [Diabrotica virgifera virgifera]XP_050509970.1 thiamin pyrophosphokinase 1 [Diabrotica virgifera virgifera]XP_050509971.1 thiamin pyrophosphokinase 1 [Diabrotica virgifera virgifera]XP_050509972.1 thiamin pyrophosphokinase 1 [Diabrotica virgifera virgifera]